MPKKYIPIAVQRAVIALSQGCYEYGLRIIGKTDIGRATADLLQVNHKSNMNLRKLLKLVGLHPPDFTE